MSDWQKGDLALCVKGGAISPVHTCRTSPVLGRIYVVERFGRRLFSSGRERPALWLVDGPKNNNGDSVWGASRFRKIPPHTPDAEDAETIRLLNGVPVGGPA